MNRGQIIDFAMRRAEVNGADIKQITRTILNLTVQRLARDFRFENFKSTDSLSFVSGTRTYDLPSDYVRHFSLKITTSTDNGTGYTPLDPVTDEEWDSFNTIGNIGQPTKFRINRKDLEVELLENPDKAYTGTLRYYMLPADQDTTDATTYDASTIALPDYILIESLIFDLFEYNEDDRSQIQYQKAAQYIKRYLISEHDQAGNQDVMLRDRRFFG